MLKCPLLHRTINKSFALIAQSLEHFNTAITIFAHTLPCSHLLVTSFVDKFIRYGLSIFTVLYFIDFHQRGITKEYLLIFIACRKNPFDLGTWGAYEDLKDYNCFPVIQTNTRIYISVKFTFKFVTNNVVLDLPYSP